MVLFYCYHYYVLLYTHSLNNGKKGNGLRYVLLFEMTLTRIFFNMVIWTMASHAGSTVSTDGSTLPCVLVSPYVSTHNAAGRTLSI